MEEPPLETVRAMEKKERGESDVAVETSTNMAAVRWKDNKVVGKTTTTNNKKQKTHFHSSKSMKTKKCF